MDAEIACEKCDAVSRAITDIIMGMHRVNKKSRYPAKENIISRKLKERMCKYLLSLSYIPIVKNGRFLWRLKAISNSAA